MPAVTDRPTALTADLVHELRALVRLTNTEIAVASVRRLQATSDSVRRELAGNADKARERAHLLTGAVRELGGLPDLVSPALGFAGALAKSNVEQAQTFATALLGDLALERQLLDRARFTRALAAAAGRPDVEALMDRLEVAHTATVEWLSARLDEVANGRRPGLRPTPLQVAVGTAVRAAFLPARTAAGLLNRTAALAVRVRGRSAAAAAVVTDAAETVVETGQTAATDAAEAVQTAAGEVTDAAQAVVVDLTDAARDAVDTAGAAVEDAAAGPVPDVAPEASHLPLKEYDRLSGDTVMRHFADMTDPVEVGELLAYERANKDRKGVVQAAEGRLAELVAEAG